MAPRMGRLRPEVDGLGGPILLQARGLEVRRGRRTILTDVGFEVGAGELLELAGANGSGKTSLLRVLAGLTHPRRGTLRRRGSCAFVAEKVALAPALRCGEWLAAMRRLRGLEPVDWERAVLASGLDANVLGRPASVLSKGMSQRIALVEAIESRCALLLLDEPFSGLDADGRAWLGERIVARLRDGSAVVLTDHSGVASRRLPPGAVLRLHDGACERGGAAVTTEPSVGADVAGAATVHVVATHPDGRRLSRGVVASASDELLRELLAEGWHVEEVRP